MDLLTLSLLTLLLPLLGALAVGLLGRRLGRDFAYVMTIACVGGATACAALTFVQINFLKVPPFEVSLYKWLDFGVLGYQFEVGILIDALSSTMMLVVTFVSLIVHIYTVGYMDYDEDYPEENPYYQRFFSYISLFTFAMLALVMSNNFLQLFFGWEAVGLVSYLLIGFYMKRESAVQANLKAFLINRVGDLGFLLGIALVLMVFGTLNYGEVFAYLNENTEQVQSLQLSIPWVFGDVQWQMVTVIAICLFIGAMGKSAQMPLHTWLPESMEGPTPISALIHAATMVTAGIYMVARLHPLFLQSEVALSMILIVGATTAFMMGLLGIVQNDIKRVVAYSTLSQLGYMVAALGASAFVGGFFHVFTHAFFKALLFLAAGSVIVALHHIQDIRQMGGLRKYMPITYWCMLLGSLSLIGTPGFSGFFSKDLILLSVADSEIFGAGYAHILLMAGVFVTAFYSFRMFFVVFHGKPSDEVLKYQPKESFHSINFSLFALVLPSVFIGWLVVDSWIFGDYFTSVMGEGDESGGKHLAENYANGLALILHSPFSMPFYLAFAGVALAWLLYCKSPDLLEKMSNRFAKVHQILLDGYGFDRFNQWFFVRGSVRLGELLWRYGDVNIIDDGIINRGAKWVGGIASKVRLMQSGLIYHYAFTLIIGVMLLLGWLVYKNIVVS
jgi:NADH-quinone oxidoreductase subunit L